MKWFFPSWNGDFRLRPNEKHSNETDLIVYDPTLDESRLLNRLGAVLVEKEWLSSWKDIAPGMWLREKKIQIRAPLEQVGPVFLGVFKPGPAVLTAVRYESGKIMTCSGGPSELTEFAEKLLEESKAAEKATKEDEKPAAAATAAVTVKRPTPSCPSCIPGSVEHAREVLETFLTPAEHATWAKERSIYVEGGLSGHLYRISHRHSEAAQKNTRICRDLDLDCIVHFHDWSVPPEEEVLAAKLVLQHRESWLRNEATMFHMLFTGEESIYKNPFGDVSDGVADASLTTTIGLSFGAGLAAGLGNG